MALVNQSRRPAGLFALLLKKTDVVDEPLMYISINLSSLVKLFPTPDTERNANQLGFCAILLRHERADTLNWLSY